MGEEEPGPTWFCSGFGAHRKAGADRSNSSQALDQDLEIFKGRTPRLWRLSPETRGLGPRQHWKDP